VRVMAQTSGQANVRTRGRRAWVARTSGQAPPGREVRADMCASMLGTLWVHAGACFRGHAGVHAFVLGVAVRGAR